MCVCSKAEPHHQQSPQHHEEQGLHYPCNISAKEPTSAISRAKSSECKQNIINLVCALERGEVYPKSLPKYCKPKIDQAQAGVHHGCYQDSFKQRLFSGSVTKFRDSNSADQCISHCVDNGYQYSGLQYGVECFCGNNKPDDKHKVRFMGGKVAEVSCKDFWR